MASSSDRNSQQRIGLVQARRPWRSIAVIRAKDPLISSRLNSAVVKSVSAVTLEWEAPRPVRCMERIGDVRTASLVPPCCGVTSRNSGPWLG